MTKYTPQDNQLEFQFAKLCECGCGQPVAIAKINSATRGWVKGQPIRFIRGHQVGQRSKHIDNSSPEKRFWSFVDKRGDDECWEWKSSTNETGYGIHTVGRKKDKNIRRFRAHRFAYELVHGPIPQGIEICHKCDNPPCCNPAHLFAGTRQQNIDDMVAKGRQALGNKNAWAKLTEDDVRQVRELHAQGLSQRKIATQFKVHNVTINDIIRGRSWRHLK